MELLAELFKLVCNLLHSFKLLTSDLPNTKTLQQQNQECFQQN